MTDLIKRLHFHSAFFAASKSRLKITSTTDIIIISISLKLRGLKIALALSTECVLKILMHYHFPTHLQAGQHYLIAYFLIN